MDAGELDQRLSIEAPDSTPDEMGQDALDYAQIATVWAKIIEAGSPIRSFGREFLSGDFRAEERMIAIIRWREIDSTNRVTWNSRTYYIDSVTGTRRGGWTTLYCKTTEGAN